MNNSEIDEFKSDSSVILAILVPIAFTLILLVLIAPLYEGRNAVQRAANTLKDDVFAEVYPWAVFNPEGLYRLQNGEMNLATLIGEVSPDSEANIDPDYMESKVVYTDYQKEHTICAQFRENDYLTYDFLTGKSKTRSIPCTTHQ